MKINFIFLLLSGLFLSIGVKAADDKADSIVYNSEGNYYEINSYEDLLELSHYTNIDKNTCSGMVFKVTAHKIVIPDTSDPNLPDSLKFDPIGMGVPFSGTFDGQGVLIGGLDRELFWHVEDGIIQNATLDETCSTIRKGGLGGYSNSFAGMIYTSKNCIISNCTFSGKIKNGLNVIHAGLIYHNEGGRVINCVYDGFVEDAYQAGFSAGLIYENYGGVIEECINKGGAHNAGIVYRDKGGKIIKCVNRGDVDNRYDGSGSSSGIVNDCLALTEFGEKQTVISKCINYGKCDAGIAESSNAIIEDCENYGNCEVGIVVDNHEDGIVKNCTNHEICSLSGIVRSNSGIIRDCINNGQVNYGGGIADHNWGTLINCSNYGKIGGEDDSDYTAYVDHHGGIVGLNSGTIIGCVNTGDVSGRYGVGGIVGENHGSVSGCLVRDCTISGDWSTGAVFGSNYSYKVSMNYYLKSVVVYSVTDGREKMYDGERERGVSTYSKDDYKDVEDIIETKEDGVVYYDGARLLLNEGGSVFVEGKYILLYLVDNAFYKMYFLNAGEEIIPEEYPVKEGFVFSGWSEIPEIMPPKNVTVTGSFSKMKDGDSNGDGTVNAADIVEVVNFIMGNPSETFKADCADANHDGVVNAADIVTIVSIIMSPPEEDTRCLVLWLKDGTSKSYIMEDHPKITFTKTGLTVRTNSKKEVDIYSLKNVRILTYPTK